MAKSGNRIFFVMLLALLSACKKADTHEQGGVRSASILSLLVNGAPVVNGGHTADLSLDTPVAVDITFSEPIDTALLDRTKIFVIGVSATSVEISQGAGADHLALTIDNKALGFLSSYQLTLTSGNNLGVNLEDGFKCTLQTGIDPAPKFPTISDDSLLTLVESQTFKYFWDFGHPVSGMARERTSSGDIVTTGGTGFGVMATIVAAQRGFITREQAAGRIQTIVSFLGTQCTRYHGAFSHWINGRTGATQPFSTYDDGGDLVETALLMQGLLAARQYFNSSDPAEATLRSDITALWEGVEWDWYRQGGQNVLYWHWSSDYGWKMNMKIAGWNEAMAIYVLAASSPTHPIPKAVYDQGWAQNGNMRNGKTFYNYVLPLGPDYGGPLFFSHYSFLGLDPHNLQDQYADYWQQNLNHTLINYNYCVANPKGFSGYGPDCWGLTASDGNNGYSAFSPTNDQGVIAPTAALSAMPYTPEESMRALHFFYYTLGDKLWTQYGFRDAFNLTARWFGPDCIAINQGPIIVMIENYRTGLLWNLLMQDTEIQAGLTALGFTY